MSTIRIFRQYIPTTFLVLAAIELGIFALSLFIGIMFGFDIDLTDLVYHIEALTSETLCFSTMMLVALAAVGLYQRRLQESRLQMVLRIILGVLTGIFIIHYIAFFFLDLTLQIEVWVPVIISAIIGIVISRLLFFPSHAIFLALTKDPHCGRRKKSASID